MEDKAEEGPIQNQLAAAQKVGWANAFAVAPLSIARVLTLWDFAGRDTLLYCYSLPSPLLGLVAEYVPWWSRAHAIVLGLPHGWCAPCLECGRPWHSWTNHFNTPYCNHTCHFLNHGDRWTNES
jgi:hypothetical protein